MVRALHVREVNGYASGTLTIRDYTNEPSNNGPATLTFEDRNGNAVSIDQAKVTSLNLLGAEVLADSTAIDVAGIVADYNALLAILRTAGVLAV